MPHSSAYDLQGACRLVGVDVIPIKVRGAASVNVTVEGHTLSHQFIVADHITAEAILGMDFLEKNECILDLCKGRLSMKDLGVVQLQPYSLKKPCTPAKVNLVETLIIPATAEVEVMAKLHTEDDNQMWMVDSPHNGCQGIGETKVWTCISTYHKHKSNTSESIQRFYCSSGRTPR